MLPAENRQPLRWRSSRSPVESGIKDRSHDDYLDGDLAGHAGARGAAAHAAGVTRSLTAPAGPANTGASHHVTPRQRRTRCKGIRSVAT